VYGSCLWRKVASVWLNQAPIEGYYRADRDNAEADATGDIEPLTARDVQKLNNPATRAEKSRQFKSFAASLKTQLPSPTTVVGASVDQRIAFGCHHLTLDAGQVAALNPRAHIDATFSDLLVAAMHRTVEDWN
jgi:hypothetical protein